jgi:NAD+ kinase
MRVLLTGKPDDHFLSAVKAVGLELCEERPDVVLSVGGDGAFIGAERAFPGIPKLGIRADASCRKCAKHTDKEMLAQLVAGRLAETVLMKLEARIGDTALRAVNDVMVRNADLRAAVRFRISLDGQRVSDELIGDGLVIATPFGSSAYFRSITGVTIRTGIGLACNNCTDNMAHLVVGENEEIGIEIVRGPAVLAVDNDPALHALNSGVMLSVRRAPQGARVLGADALRCADCRYVNAPRRRF